MQRTAKIIGLFVFVVVLAWLSSFGSKPEETVSVENAIVRGEWEEVVDDGPALRDPMTDQLWEESRFSQTYYISDGTWGRANYGLVRVYQLDGCSFLELTPSGNIAWWENFGLLTAATKQVVVAPGSPKLESYLSNGRASWGTLCVHMAGKNPDGAVATTVVFIPFGERIDLAFTPDE